MEATWNATLLLSSNGNCKTSSASTTPTKTVTTSNVLYAFSNIGTLFSSNVAKVDFTKLGYTIGQPLTLINTDSNVTYRLTIADLSSTQLVASGLSNVIPLGSNVQLKYYDYENSNYGRCRFYRY